MKISCKVWTGTLLVMAGIFSIALRANAGCNNANGTEVTLGVDGPKYVGISTTREWTFTLKDENGTDLQPSGNDVTWTIPTGFSLVSGYTLTGSLSIQLTVPATQGANKSDTHEIKCTYQESGMDASCEVTIDVLVIKGEILRHVPDGDICLVGSPFSYECKILPADLTIDNYKWTLDRTCNTSSSDPYECPESSGHDSTRTGPDGKAHNTWVTVTPLGFDHAGQHEIKCEVTIGDEKGTLSKSQEVEPCAKVTGVDINLPGGGGTYDPVWDDEDWSLTANGSAAVSAANDSDTAEIDFTLNKDCQKVLINVYQDVLGTGNPVVHSEYKYTVERGNHSGDWYIDNEKEDDYFAKVQAWGGVDATADVDEEKSSNVDVVRMHYFTSAGINVDDDQAWVVKYWEEWMNSALVAGGVTVSCSVGAPVIMTAKTASFLGLFAGITLGTGPTSPVAVQGIGTGTEHYGFAVPCTAYFWDNGISSYVRSSSVLWKVLGRTAYSAGVGYPPGSSSPVSSHFPRISSSHEGWMVHPRWWGGDWYDEAVYQQRPESGSDNLCQRGLLWKINFQ